jgi:hypothetical protein
MDFLVTVFIFLVIVFLYIHIIAEYKKSEDLEIYEMDFESNEQLHEICNIKQPVLFEYASFNKDVFTHVKIDYILKNGATHEIFIKNTNDYWKSKHNDEGADSVTIDSVAFPFKSSIKLLESDDKSHYISEGNSIFLQDSGLEKTMREIDADLKPPFAISTTYDLLLGSKNASTPMRYHTNSRHYIGVTHGKIQVKMAPWKYSRYLHPVSDYENYEFRSSINMWNCQDKYKLDMDKIKTIDFDIPAGNVLFIPPYWWYSIKFLDRNDNSVFSVNYSTIVNSLANIGDLGRYYIQQQNITHKLTKTHLFVKSDLPPIEKETKEKETKEEKIPIVVIDEVSQDIIKNEEQYEIPATMDVNTGGLDPSKNDICA